MSQDSKQRPRTCVGTRLCLCCCLTSSGSDVTMGEDEDTRSELYKALLESDGPSSVVSDHLPVLTEKYKLCTYSVLYKILKENSTYVCCTQTAIHRLHCELVYTAACCSTHIQYCQVSVHNSSKQQCTPECTHAAKQGHKN